MALLDITALKAKIDAQITTNGNKEITGAQLNEILKDLIDSGPNFISNAGSIGLADYVATEIYNENDEGQSVVFNDEIYQAKPGETNITGVFDPLKWDLVGSAGGGITDVNGDSGPSITLDTDDISDATAVNKYVTSAEKALIASASQSGDNVSDFVNDAGYLTSIPASYLESGDNISELVNDSGYLTSIPASYLESGDNISELVNDAGYVTTDTNTNFANTNLTLVANRVHDGSTFTQRFNNTNWGINTSATASADITLYATKTSQGLYGSGRGIALNAAYFDNSGTKNALYATVNASGTGKSFETGYGNVRLNTLGGITGIGSLNASSKLYVLSTDVAQTDGILAVNNQVQTTGYGIRSSVQNGTTKVGGFFECVNATNNIAIQGGNGKVMLNTTDTGAAGDARTYIGYGISGSQSGRANVKAGANDSFIMHHETDSANGNLVQLITHNDNTRSVSMPNLPTSSAGLSAGDLWNNSGVINIV